MKMTKTIILRVSNNCNLNCSYCYDKLNHNNHCNPDQEFRNNIENIICCLNKIFLLDKSTKGEIIFHGGEPLLIKPSTYRLFIDKLSTCKRQINYTIQTNGTLITKEMIDVLKDYNINVGISLDGCNAKQNAARVYLGGKETFNDCLRVKNLLRENNVNFGIIMSINKNHLGSEQEIYDFIAREKICCNIKPIFPTTNSNSDIIMTSEEFGNFFNNIFDIWFNDEKEKVSLRQIPEFVSEIKKVIDSGYKEELCSCSGDCFSNIICIDIYGNAYACNRLYNIKEFYYGNILNDPMENIIKNMKKLSRKRKKAITKSCSQCSLYNKCLGGCPATAYLSYGNYLEKDPECAVKLMISEHIKKKIYR